LKKIEEYVQIYEDKLKKFEAIKIDLEKIDSEIKIEKMKREKYNDENDNIRKKEIKNNLEVTSKLNSEGLGELVKIEKTKIYEIA